MAFLPEPSDEQQAVVSAIADGGRSVMVNAVAGSGKSTTVLTLARQNPGLQILLLSYNRDLKLELRKKTAEHGLDNVEVHSYHSLAVKYYDNKAYTDEILSRAVTRDAPIRKPVRRFDVIVTDEAQDIIPVFQRLVNKFAKDSESQDCRFLVIGDARQAIYSFKGADSRFLTLADALRPGKAMMKLSLTESYRLTKKCASFVNSAVYGTEVIRSRRPGGSVDYYTGNVFKDAPAWCAQQIRRMIHMEGYAPDDFFILSPSVKSEKSPYKRLENILSSSNIPCFVPISDESNLSDKIIKGKITFTTYHQSKGRERKVVFVYGFDSGFYKIFRNESKEECPHAMYVAITRATERLYLVQGEREEPMPFLRRSVVDMHADGSLRLHGGGRSAPTGATGQGKDGRDEKEQYHSTSVTDLVKFLKPKTLVQMHELCQDLFEKEDPGYHDVEIKHEIETGDDRFEEVSDVNGLAIPSMWEQRRFGQLPTVHRFLLNQVTPDNKFLASMLRKLPNRCEAVSEFLYVANAYLTYTNNVYFKMKQIRGYGWLDDADLETCMEVLDNNLGPAAGGSEDLEFETPLRSRYHSDHGLVLIKGRIDIVSKNEAYEIKCVQSLSLENMLQTIVYKWMYFDNAKDDKKDFVLLNIRTGERLKVKNVWYKIFSVISTLVNNRYEQLVVKDDEDFISDNVSP